MSVPTPSIVPIKIRVTPETDLLEYLFLHDIDCRLLDRHVEGLMQFLQAKTKRENIETYFRTLETVFHGERDRIRRIALLFLFLSAAMEPRYTEISHGFIRARCPTDRFDAFYDAWNIEMKRFRRGECFVELTAEEKRAIEASEKRSKANSTNTTSSTPQNVSMNKPPLRSTGDVRYEHAEHFLITLMSFYLNY